MSEIPESIDTLDLGCGQAKEPGAFGVDRVGGGGVDLVADLDRHPYDLPDARFSRIVCRHIVEHLDDIPAFFDELHRVARPGCRIEIAAPHFSNRCSYADPTHRHHLSMQFVDFVADVPRLPARTGLFAAGSHWLLEHLFDHEPFAGADRFRLVSRRVTFARLFRITGIGWLMNRYHRLWEFYLAFLIPARDIEIVLEVAR